MRHLLSVISAVLVLVAVVTGCGGTHRYDSRLTAADSLMHSDPDSALAIVEGIDRDSLADEGDRAYRDLLLTQARYKAYVTATSDSDINRALAYYHAHPKEREKLTRAYIYKGAVMEELGHPDSAMLYYKTAEATAAPDDYFNLGYAKLQMGALYNRFYSMDGKESQKYEEALECYRLAKDSVYILVCLNNLGCQYRESNPDSAESLLREAYLLAKTMRDTMRIVYNSWSLVELDYDQGKYQDALQRVQEIVGYGIDDFDYKFFFTASTVYAKLGILDTAEMYFCHASNGQSENDALYNMYRLETLGELALSRKDSLSFLKFERESGRIADSLKSNSQKLDILNAETTYDKELKRQSQNIYLKTLSSYRWLIALGIAVLFVFACLYYRRGHRYDRLISELKEENENQLIDLETLQKNVNELKIKDIELKEFISSHIDMMCKVLEECYHTPQGRLSKEIRKIVKYQDEKSGMWNKLYQYLDLQYNNIMSDTMKRFPQLSEKELLMIALTCMGYSCAQIAIVLDYSNSSGISTIRKRIAAKMGLDCLLGDYIDQYKTSH